MKKSAVILTLCVLLLAVFAAPVFAAGNGQMKEGSMYVDTANHKSLHFRADPKSSPDNIIGEIPYGAKVYVVKWSGGWARVKYGGLYGYVSTSFLSPSRPGTREAANAPVPTEVPDGTDTSDILPAAYDVTVVTETAEGTVRMFSEPRMSAKQVMLLSNGARLAVTGENRDWAQVVDGETGTTGYMLKTFLAADLIEEEMLEDDLPEDELTEDGLSEEELLEEETGGPEEVLSGEDDYV